MTSQNFLGSVYRCKLSGQVIFSLPIQSVWKFTMGELFVEFLRAKWLVFEVLALEIRQKVLPLWNFIQIVSPGKNKLTQQFTPMETSYKFCEIIFHIGWKWVTVLHSWLPGPLFWYFLFKKWGWFLSKFGKKCAKIAYMKGRYLKTSAPPGFLVEEGTKEVTKLCSSKIFPWRHS